MTTKARLALEAQQKAIIALLAMKLAEDDEIESAADMFVAGIVIAYGMALEIGLRIGINDIVSARRLLAEIDDGVELDADAAEGREIWVRRLMDAVR